MSIEHSDSPPGERPRMTALAGLLRRTRRTQADRVEQRLSIVMIIATLLVIPVLVLEVQPLGEPWHTITAFGDWVIWLVFVVEFAAIILLAHDWRTWLRKYPLAPALIVLTPPFAPASIQALRLFRMLRLLRLARGFQILSKLLTLDGLKLVAVLAVFLVVGGGAGFAGAESHAGHHVSTWDGVWWAASNLTTGSNIEVHTTAGRVIAIVLRLSGVGVFSIITGAVAQHFLAGKHAKSPEPSRGEQAIIDRLDEISHRLNGVEIAQLAGALSPHGASQRISGRGHPPGSHGHDGNESDTGFVG